MFINIEFWLGCDRPLRLLFRARFASFPTHASRLAFFVFRLSYFILAVPIRERLGKH